MATYSSIETFDSYSTGAISGLNGGSGWGGVWDTSTHVTVQNTTVFAGANAATIVSDSNAYVKRQMAAGVDSGDLYFAMRTDGVSGTSGAYAVLEVVTSSPADQFYVQMFQTGGATRTDLIYAGTTSATLLSGIAANTWYIININFVSSTSARGRYKAAGGSWSSFGSTVTYGGSMSSPTHIALAQNGVVNYYFDQIGTTDPDVAVSSHFLSTLGVGA